MSELTIDALGVGSHVFSQSVLDVDFVSVLPDEDVVSHATLDLVTGRIQDVDFFEDQEGFCTEHYVEYGFDRFEAIEVGDGEFVLKDLKDLASIIENMRY